jgi:outer membrane immunogenic protein
MADEIIEPICHTGTFTIDITRRRTKMVKVKMLVAGLFATLLCASTSMAQSASSTQEFMRNEVSIQGTGFFTKDSEGRGIRQHTTDSGGLLASYRYHFSPWLAVDVSYGYTRNTQQNFTPGREFAVQSDVHQATGALVVNSPNKVAGLITPFGLVGAGALFFEPTHNPGGFVLAARGHTKEAFVYGGGADINITDRFAVRLAYRGLVYRRPDFKLFELDSNATTHTAQPSAGIVFRF